MNSWTDWKTIDDVCEVAESAVYQVRIVDGNLKPYSINRFLGIDKNGIVCIGESSNMERRRRQFLTAIKKAYGHSSMNLVFYLKKYTKLEKVFCPYLFQYCYSTCDTGERKKIESALAKKYFKQFGEVPPLNSILPDRYNCWDD